MRQQRKKVSSVASAQPRYFGFVDRVSADEVTGWAVNLQDISKNVDVRLLLDGVLVVTSSCTILREDLTDIGITESECGFAIRLDNYKVQASSKLAVVIADGEADYELPFKPGLVFSNASVRLPQPSNDAASQVTAMAPNGSSPIDLQIPAAAGPASFVLTNLRVEADRLWQEGSWSEARQVYTQCVSLKVDDAVAWQRIGDCAFEAGDQENSDGAYRISLMYAPRAIYIEVDDLLDYLRNHRTLSGIQRVQAGVIRYALGEEDRNPASYAFIRTIRRMSGVGRLHPRHLRKIIDYVSQALVSQEILLDLIHEAEQHATYVEPQSGQVYIILGAFWGFASNAARYTKLKTAGVTVGVYIYDLIPITHPEYCAAGLVSEFTFALGDGLQAFDFILTISENVAGHVRKFLHSNNLRQIPVEAVPLAHQFHDRLPSLQPKVWKGQIAPFERRRFVLMVSTIEARKNHMYLYSVWKALLEEGLEPPDLVFVGRFGWRVNDMRDMLQETGFLGGRIHVIHDLSDVDLELLYETCLFTAFPSFVEGWGLPVGESLTHGRPCVASNTSSVPEVGGDLVDYVDPWNVQDGVRVFKRMIIDDAYRQSRVTNIKEQFVPRTWAEVSKDLFGRIETLRQFPPAQYIPPMLLPGELLIPGELSIGKTPPANYAARPLRPIISEGWYPAEPFGTWMVGNKSTLRFSTDCAPGTRVAAYLHFAGAPWITNHIVTVQIGKTVERSARQIVFPKRLSETSKPSIIRAADEFFCHVSGVVEQDGTILISIAVEGEIVNDHTAKSLHDDRVFYIGLIKMGYAVSTDVALRVDLFEHFSKAA